MRKLLFFLLFALIGTTISYGQSQTITGKITDENGAPVEGASVTIKGTKTGTAASATGNFSITAKKGDVLVFSSVNFAPVEMTVSDQTVLNVTLSRSEGEINEVVVTAVGIRREERSLGYSVVKVNPDDLVQKSEPDMLKSLEGKVPGVDIRSSQGTPGAATRIQIRGNNSFFGNTQPLIIVDGIPYSNQQITTSSQTVGGTAYSSGISNLDPNDIASMNVLKGSAAAALYGSRASNGVLIITTKSGSASRSRKGLEVNYRSSFSIETVANLPSYQNEYGAGSNFNYQNANGSWGPSFSSRDSIPAWPDFKAAYPDLFPSDNIAYRAYPDNVKDLFQTGTVYENSIGFNGGNEKTSFALTASQLNQKGYVPNSMFNRTNIGVGGSSKLDIGLNVQGNLSYSRSTQKGGYFGENQVDGAASQFARTLFLARNWDLNLPYEKNITPNGGAQFDNPRWSAEHNVATTYDERYVAGVHFDFNIRPWFRVDYQIGTNINTLNRREITDIGSRAAEGTGRIVLDNVRNQEIESNLLFTLTPTIGEDFSLKVVLGDNFNQRTFTRQTNTGSKFITPGIFTLLNTSQQTFNTDYYERRRIMGVFADVVLGYKNYAFINVTGRNDWSSTLPVESRSYFYPSVSGSLVFTDALHMNSKILDFGKIRAGWAKVGRDADPYSLQNVFALGTNFLGQPTASTGSTSFDPNLKPEFTQEIELGTNLSFLTRRIELDFTWYNRLSTNLIAPITTPSSTGYSQYYTNFGKIRNKGIEVGLTVRPIKTQSFTWEINGAFTKNTNTVEELTEGVSSFPQAGILSGTISPYFEAGMPYGYLRGTKSLRDDQGNLLIDPGTGLLIADPTEGYIGNPNPDYKLGITNTLSYKGFFLTALFDMTKGGDIYSVTVSSLLGRGVTNDTRDREASWVIPGVYGDANTGKPILDAGGKTIENHTRVTTNDLYFGNSFAINSQTEWNVYDATVYRIREVSLGYDFPKSLFKRLPIGSLNLSVSARNLWYLAPNMPKYTNFDPEVNSYGSAAVQGIELSAAPTTRRFGVNLNVTF